MLVVGLGILLCLSSWRLIPFELIRGVILTVV